MNKALLRIISLAAAACITLSLASCGGDKKEADTVADETTAAQAQTIDCDITEKYYVAYINDIYSTNFKNYVGKTIRIEGMFKTETAEDGTYYYVYRIGPGCCGNDGSMCGFEFTYDGDMPAEGDWIRIVGTLGSYELGGNTYLTITASSVEILPDDQRGAENVGN